MRYGLIVAERYRKQYFKRNKWNTFVDWEIQPEQVHLILCELKSKEAINALIGNESWTKRLDRKKRKNG